ncbi:sugar phosphate isomerase/epimerase [Alkalicoccobacillus porphyridii]|uniref:Sugar phosphate isomerase/epimerase n=2 Tax=Alkalicoccobacillus porphyridii TaxID=2597270 RepID=A0A554A4N2_9BACI|nr:sugar phosphate isomerase/epimerase [Alkalicoccobacillus porphyridii]
MSWWGMNGLFEDEKGTEEKVHLIAEAGYDGINGFLPDEREAEQWHRLLDQYNLSFSVNAYPKTVHDLEIFLRSAQEFGKVDFINVQVMRPFLIGEEAVKLLDGMVRISRSIGIPAYIETHRGTITQDLIRTAEYVQCLPELKLTIDLSHYIVAGEMHTISEEAEEKIQSLLTQTTSIHARVSNGEQIQVDIDEANHQVLDHFKRWWLTGMRNWNVHSEDEVLPFVCELGPPPYAIKVGGTEPGDRWSQSLEFARIARSLWDQV